MKEVNYEELMELILNYYDAFKEVMKKGTDFEKAYALKTFGDVRRLIAQRLGEVGDFDFEKLDKLLAKDTSEWGTQMRGFKEELIQSAEEVDPLIKKLEEKLGPRKTNKIRKKRMEMRIKTKG